MIYAGSCFAQSAEHGTGQAGAIEPALSEDSAAVITTIVVTGTLVRGIKPVGSQTVTVSRDKVEESGAASVAELLQSIVQMPAFNNLQFPLARCNCQTTNRPNLRGITVLGSTGSSATLVLVDGHRLVGMGVLATTPDPDVVPPAAIERVEIVLDGGSSIYGSDAVAGVMNFVTRRKFEGVKLDASYGFAKNLQSFGANATAGTKWQGGSAFLSYNFAKHDALYGRDRDFVRRFPKTVAGIPFPVTSLSCAQGNVQLLPAGTVYALPYAAGAGQANTANQCDDSDGYSFYPRSELHSVFAGVTQRLSDAVELELRGYFLDRHEWQTTGGFYVTNFVGPALFGLVNSPFRTANSATGSPFEVHQVSTARLDADAASIRSSLRTWGLTPSLTADLGASWQLRAFGNVGSSRNTVNNRIGNGVAAQNAIGAGLTNPYILTASDPRGNAVVQDYEIYGLTRQHLYNARAVADGNLLKLPGGPVKLAFGGEFLRETLWTRNGQSAPGFAESGAPAVSLPANLPGSPTVLIRPAIAPLPVVRLARNTVSLFGELVVPLFGKDNGGPGMEELTLSASARYDRYSDVGGTFNPKFGAVYRPVEWIKLRASWGKSFVAPSLVDAAEAVPTQFGFGINFPVLFPPASLIANGTWPAPRPGQIAVAVLTGNAPGTRPQSSKSLSLGMELDPPFAPGLNLSATYWKTDFKDAIGAPPITNQSVFWSRFPPQIAVNPTAAQIADAFAVADVLLTNPCAPLPGCVYAIIDGRKRNISSHKFDGIDFTARYERPTGFGSINFEFLASYALHDRTSPRPGVPFLDAYAANVSRFRFHAVAGARIGALRVAATLNHSAGYRLDPPAGVAPRQTRVGAFDVVNLFARYAFNGSGALGGLALTLHIDNVLDQDPPEWRETQVDAQFSGFANGNTLGRFVRVSIGKKF